MPSDAPPPPAWPVASDWRERAERIGARLRGRENAIRGLAVAGDYPAGIAWEASLLRIVVFPHAEQPRIDQGAIAYDGDVPYVVDRITTGLLTELEALLAQEPLAGTLAGLTPLRLTDAALRDLLPAFRDRYHSAEGREQRIRRALQAAKVALDDCEAGGPPVLAVEALQNGLAPAVNAALGEPPDPLRLPRRLRAAARILRIDALADAAAAAFALPQRDPNELWKAVDNLDALARAHLEARLPELAPALTPQLDRILHPAQRATQTQQHPPAPPTATPPNTAPPAATSPGTAPPSATSPDAAPPTATSPATAPLGATSPDAAWPALSAAAELDALIERASPGWRERDDYAQRAQLIYATPDTAHLQTIRRRLRATLE